MRKNTIVINIILIITICFSTNLFARVNIGLESIAIGQTSAVNRQGGVIAKLDKDQIEINGNIYNLSEKTTIYDLYGKVNNKFKLAPRMFVNFTVFSENNDMKIYKIWVIKE